MGSSSSRQTVGWKYRLSVHSVMTSGPVDKLMRLRFDKKDAWVGECTGGSIQVSAEGLFGGEDREGGVSGTIDVDMGYPDNTQNSYLASILGAVVPNFRGVVSFIFNQFYFGMSPYLKVWDARMERIHVRGGGAAQWYDAKAEIPRTDPGVRIEQRPNYFTTLTDYTLDAGVITPFSISTGAYGKEVAIAKTAGAGTCQISRSIPATPFIGLSIKFMLTGQDSDDAGEFALVDSLGADVLYLLPMRETALDPLRRARIYINGTPYLLSDAALELNEWYRADLDYDEDGTGYTVTLTRLSGSVVMGSQHFAHPSTLGTVVGIYFGMDNAAHGCSIKYSDLRIRSVYGLGADMNPAHVIRELLTERRGKGEPTANIDDASFTAAADLFASEGLGFSYEWQRENTLDDFIGEVLRHCDAQLYFDRIDRLWKLYPVRDDYVLADLPVLDASHVKSVTDYKITDPSALINSVIVRYWDSQTGETATSPPVQDLALIQMLEGINQRTVDYPGCTQLTLASRLAARDLRALGSPLVSCTVTTTRVAYNWHKGKPFRLVWPNLKLDTVMRVGEIDFGDGVSNAITITCLQDVFALPAATTATASAYAWTDPVNAPQPCPHTLAIEAPYYEIVQRMGQDNADNKLASAPEVGYFLAAGDSPTGDALNARLWRDPGAGYSESVLVNFAPSAILSAAVGPDDTVLPITTGIDLDRLAVATHAQLGDELVRIDEVTASSITVGRGCLDTVPAPHDAGTLLMGWDADGASDNVEYALGETIAAKLVTVTGRGVLDILDAEIASVTMAQRAIRPYPPGQFKVNGSYYPDTIGGTDELGISWVGRDRIQQTAGTILDHTAGNVGPEAGTTNTLRIYGEAGSLLRTVSPATSPYTYASADELADSSLAAGSLSIAQRGAVLTAADAAATDWFGVSVALDSTGTIMAVGATQWEGGIANQGGVYIYDWSGSAWVQRGAVLTASDAASSDGYGIDVALNGDGTILAVGAFLWEGGASNQGGVYIYDWSGSAWVQRGSVLTASDAAADDRFGMSVALSDDGLVLAVGAYLWEGPKADQGGVYIYDWSGSAWVQRGSVLTASDAVAGDSFGKAVSLNANGTILAVGARDRDATYTDQGGVYIYDWSGSAWVQRGSVLTASDAVAGDFFGATVELNGSGTMLAVGAYLWEGPNADQGGVYIYDWSGSAWVQRGSVLTASDAAATDYYGVSVALNGDGSIMTVGAQQWEGTLTDQGGVYVYDWNASYRLNGWLRAELESVRDGLASFQYHNHTVYRTGWDFGWDMGWS